MIATGVVFGLAPAWITSKTTVNDSLKEGALNTTSEPGRRYLRNALMVCEITLALVLLTGGGLLVRTFVKLVALDLGINPKNAVTMNVNCPLTSMYRRVSS